MCAPCARQRPVADECVEGAVRRRSPLSGPHGLGPLWHRASGITTSQPCLLLFSILHSSLASTLSSLYHFIFVQTLCSPTFAGRFGDSCKPKQEDSKYPIPSNTTQLSVCNYTCSSQLNSFFSPNDPCCFCLSASKIQSRCSFTPM